ncbi:hypothetical protein ACFYS7_35250 [Streptomyces avermitilis]|uniref:hypothetical protein n=1 Tax=Streptomyces avermitilis TaxID=33903 RepID=UPI0036CA0CE8
MINAVLRGLAAAALTALPVIAPTPAHAIKLTLLVDTWVSDHYGDPHVEVHPHHSAA